MEIKDIDLRVILDSRGKETVAAKVIDNLRNEAEAMAPSGTSRSAYEAVPLVNGSAKETAALLPTYKRRLIGLDPREQREVDAMLREIDGTSNFERIGGNAATAISIAVAKLAAMEEKAELYRYIYDYYTKPIGIRLRIPRLLGNVIGGGAHSNNKMSFQEILLASSTRNVLLGAKKNIAIHAAIGDYLKKKGLVLGTNIENAWNSRLGDMEAIMLAESYAKKENVGLGLDCAASEFYKEGKYLFGGRALGKEAYAQILHDLTNKYHLVYLEDPFVSSDFDSFAELTQKIGKKVLVVGDDLYATNKQRLEEGLKKKSTNGILIKVNQVGTISDTIETVALAHKKGIKVIVSHRSGETTDNFLAHLAVAFGAEYIKCGIIGGERIAKINELAKIESMLKASK